MERLQPQMADEKTHFLLQKLSLKKYLLDLIVSNPAPALSIALRDVKKLQVFGMFLSKIDLKLNGTQEFSSSFVR